MKSKVFAIIILITIIGLGLFINFGDRKTYTYKVDNISRISINDKEITSQKSINKLTKILNKETNIESVQDYPINAKEVIEIKLNTDTVYVYKRTFRYYFEIPYNGTYRITKADYNYIKSLLSES